MLQGEIRRKHYTKLRYDKNGYRDGVVTWASYGWVVPIDLLTGIHTDPVGRGKAI